MAEIDIFYWKSQDPKSDISTQREKTISSLIQKNILKKEGDCTKIANGSLFRELIFAVWCVNIAQNRMKHVKKENENVIIAHEHLKTVNKRIRSPIKKEEEPGLKFIPEEFYSLIGLHDRSSFIFSRNESSLNAPFIESPFSNYATNAEDASFCVAKHKFLFNLTQAYQKQNTVKKNIFDIIKCLEDSCKTCKEENLVKHLTAHLPDNTIGYAWDGLGFYIDVLPEILSIFMTGLKDYYVDEDMEKLLNELCSIYWGLKYDCDEYAGNDKPHDNLLFNEVDVRLLKNISNSSHNVMVEFTTIADQIKLSTDYIPKKVQNFHAIKSQTLGKAHLFINSFCKEDVLKGNLSSIEKHLTLHSDDISISGMGSQYPPMNQSEWAEHGFLQLRNIFNDTFTRIEDKLSQIFLQNIQ